MVLLRTPGSMNISQGFNRHIIFMIYLQYWFYFHGSFLRNGKSFWTGPSISTFHKYWNHLMMLHQPAPRSMVILYIWRVWLLTYYTFFSTMVVTKINIVDDNKEPKQRTVLDIGCGPSISNIISASKWSQNIILADFLDSNRKEVERFWKVNIL